MKRPLGEYPDLLSPGVKLFLLALFVLLLFGVPIIGEIMGPVEPMPLGSLRNPD